jgi:hypothetical protein
VLTGHQPLEELPGGGLVERPQRRRRRRGRAKLLARIAGGVALVLAAMALVTVHQSWRNAPAAGQPGVDGVPVAAVAQSEASDAKIQVFIEHTATDQDAARAAELATYLKEHGFAVADVRSVDFQVHRPSVRFFFAHDRPNSERLVAAVRAFFADDPAEAPDHPTDLSGDAQKPRDGEIEVWLATS